MMNKSLIIILFLSGFYCNMFSQNFQTVFSNKIHLLRANEPCEYAGWAQKYVQGIRIDSVKHCDEYKVFYTYNEAEIVKDEDTYGETCVNTNRVPWCGKKIEIHNNGDNIFYTKENNSIVIKTSAEMGDSWILFQNDTLRIMAKVMDIYPRYRHGITDTIKSIRLNIVGNTIGGELQKIENQYIEIGKYYGLIYFINVRDFPRKIQFYEYRDLIHTNNNEVLFKRRDFFDHDVGDEFYTEVVYETTEIYRMEKSTVMDKKYFNNMDSVKLHVSVTSLYEDKEPVKKNLLYGKLDSSIFIKHDFPTNTLPFELIYNIDSSIVACYSVVSDDNYYNGRYIVKVFGFTFPYYFPDESCYCFSPTVKKRGFDDIWMWTWPVGSVKYIEGCGKYLKKLQPEPHASTAVVDCAPCETLIGYRKTNEEYLPYFVDGINPNEKQSKNKIKIYPNPFTDSFSIEKESVGKKYNLAFFNSLGKVVYFASDISDCIHNVRLQKIPAGVYIVQIYNSAESFCYKLIKN